MILSMPFAAEMRGESARSAARGGPGGVAAATSVQCGWLFPVSLYSAVGRAARISHFLETGTSRQP